MSIIRIKRSTVSGNPNVLAAGELAYSALTDNGSNGGERLYIGIGSETGGNAANHYVIGGTYFTSKLDHTPGTLTASSAIIVDANNKIDILNVDNVTINGNTISTTDTNGNLTLSPNGTGLISVAGQYTLPRVDGTNGYVLTTNGAGVASWQATSANPILSIAGTTNTSTVTLNSQSLTINGNGAITTNATAQTITISVATATTTVIGAASFNSASFQVDAGSVSIKTAGVSNAQLANSSITLNGTTLSLGTTTTITAVNPNALTIGTGLSGSSYDGSTGVTIAIDGTVATTSTAQVLTNKTIAAGSNTISGLTNSNLSGSAGITNANLANSSITVNGTLLSLGTTTTITAVNPNALTIGTGLSGSSYSGEAGVTIAIDGTVATTSTAQVLTNKTIAAGSNTISGLTNSNLSGTAGITNANLANSAITIGGSTISLGGTTSSFVGLTEVTVDNLFFNGNEISSTNADGNVVINPNGTGTVNVSTSRIINVAEPTALTDAATKGYVDNVVNGLTWKDPVNLLSTSTVALSGTSGTLVIDGHAALSSTSTGYRLLLVGQTTSADNGIYTYTDAGSGYTLTRSEDADVYTELVGASVLVLEGNLYAKTAWVQSNHYITSFASQQWVQFSSPASYTAGAGLSLNGVEFSVNATNGVEVVSDNVQLAASVAGDGLTFNTGVVAVGAGTGITVTANAVEISASYIGQTSITTLGTVTTGTWSADTIAANKGGTGLTSYANYDLIYGTTSGPLGKLAIGTAGQVLQVNTAGNALVYADIDGGEY